MNSMIKKVILFILFGCFYVTIEVFYRGYSHPLMFLVAGISAVIVDAFNNKISWEIPILLQALYGTFIILILELFSGYFGLYILGTRIWDYTSLPFSYCNGFICLPFAVIWYGLTILMIVLADIINYYFLHDEVRPYYVLNKNGKRWYLPEKQLK